MEKNKSRFSFIGKSIDSGRKLGSVSLNPEIVCLTTLNKLNINDKGREVMGLKEGDYIQILDNIAQASDKNDRFYVCKAVEVDGEIKGGKLSKKGDFNYNVAWGTMLFSAIREQNVSMIGYDNLVEEKILAKYETEAGNETMRSQYKVYFQIESVGVAPVAESRDGDVIEAEVFSLKPIRVKAAGSDDDPQTDDDLAEGNE